VTGIYAVTAVGLFVYPGVWAPIVSVSSAALLAALLVLQFVFTADESELERSRAERMRLDQELAIGREIQASLLPKRPEGVARSSSLTIGLPNSEQPAAVPPGNQQPITSNQQRLSPFVASYGSFTVVGWSEPSREVGGDFYDVFPLEAGRLGLALGDVSGKGVPGALFMAVTMTLLQSHAHLFPNPEEVLARTNEALYPRMRGKKAAPGSGLRAPGEGAQQSSPVPVSPPLSTRSHEPRAANRMFVTAFYGVLDTGDGRLCYASAGQTPPIRISANGQPEYLTARGVPLGALPRPSYDRHEVVLQPGERLVLASDGFIEARLRGGSRSGDPPPHPRLAPPGRVVRSGACPTERSEGAGYPHAARVVTSAGGYPAATGPREREESARVEREHRRAAAGTTSEARGRGSRPSAPTQDQPRKAALAGIGPLGYDRFLEMVARHSHLDPEAFALGVLADFRSRLVDPEPGSRERSEWVADDLTLLIVARSA
jgi:hypothetical protein